MMLTTHSLSLVGAKLPRRWLARANEALALSAPAPPWRAISTSAAPVYIWHSIYPCRHYRIAHSPVESRIDESPGRFADDVNALVWGH